MQNAFRQQRPLDKHPGITTFYCSVMVVGVGRPSYATNRQAVDRRRALLPCPTPFPTAVALLFLQHTFLWCCCAPSLPGLVEKEEGAQAEEHGTDRTGGTVACWWQAWWDWWDLLGLAGTQVAAWQGEQQHFLPTSPRLHCLPPPLP